MRDLPYFPFDEQGYRPSVGLAALAPERWIEPDEHAAEQLPLRAELLANCRNDILQYREEAGNACLELNRTVRHNLLEHHRGYASGMPRQIRITPTDITLDAPTIGLNALEQLAHLVQEDICILSAEEEPRLIAALVCFPSHWQVKEKMGLTSDGIHAVVPKFAEKLATPTNAILQKLSAKRPMWRINWSIDGNNELHTPGLKTFRQDLTVDNVLDSTWLRIERQTLRRLPESGSMVFTIKTYLHRMTDVASCPTRRTKLLASLKTIPPDTADYKGLSDVLPLLVQAIGK
ncbi:MAG: DUF3445 domain-containing protein [Planctomycetaceae bacterium]|nr:DUF3445 domain-containing protein [Planctomycetaceae bacterium]MCB9949745.1 DUF3445 domain-containing protein [Planctomycetaceae bacterium]